ncbi:endospore germination permease [Paenibacillus sp. GCM10012307]|uniref:Endospore germination permease n=1 Tax=Paenibacillus roseus TaxID=2798579 RepID=A0A934MW17_9BACL|nr:endospore germination permease [Paenibacillus roseus]MBJ6362697.1 endospore germination permease [Paenibacillus roseus]
MEKQVIGTRQFAILVLFFIIGDMLWFLPSFMVEAVEQDAWISALIGVPVGMLAAWFLFHFANQFPNMSLVEINWTVLGKWLGSALTIIYLLSFFTVSVVQIRQVSDFITSQMMTETPLRAINMLMTIIVMIGVWSGLQTFARTGEIFIMLFAFMFLLLIILLMPQIKVDNILPMMRHSFSSFAQGVVYFVSYSFLEMYVFLMIFPYVKRSSHLFRDYMLSALLGGVAIFLIVTTSLLVLGPFLSRFHLFATYILAKKISIGGFLDRLEAILVVNFILSTYFKATLFAYGFVMGITRLLKLKDYRILIVPVGFMIFGYSYIVYPNLVVLNNVTPAWSLWDMTHNPIILLLIYIIHKLRSTNRNRHKSESSEEA